MARQREPVVLSAAEVVGLNMSVAAASARVAARASVQEEPAPRELPALAGARIETQIEWLNEMMYPPLALPAFGVEGSLNDEGESTETQGMSLGGWP
ncbi:hypothetical protein T492DRAFT_870360 [Pavlovales sp. CCMP2436]|nr:hypothetical protein T492DRAFT_870360 [Pavlovales sp. CCMP2436]